MECGGPCSHLLLTAVSSDPITGRQPSLPGTLVFGFHKPFPLDEGYLAHVCYTQSGKMRTAEPCRTLQCSREPRVTYDYAVSGQGDDGVEEITDPSWRHVEIVSRFTSKCCPSWSYVTLCTFVLRAEDLQPDHMTSQSSEHVTHTA